jgi:hypothetical protein
MAWLSQLEYSQCIDDQNPRGRRFRDRKERTVIDDVFEKRRICPPEKSLYYLADSSPNNNLIDIEVRNRAANAPGSVDNSRVFHGDRRALLCRDLRVFVIPGTADVAHDC